MFVSVSLVRNAAFMSMSLNIVLMVMWCFLVGAFIVFLTLVRTVRLSSGTFSPLQAVSSPGLILLSDPGPIVTSPGCVQQHRLRQLTLGQPSTV